MEKKQALLLCEGYLALVAFACGVPSALAQSSTYYPKQATESDRSQPTNQATGYVETRIGSGGWRGSAVVARHPQLLYSCAHVYWLDGAWAAAGDIEFHRLLHQENAPPPGGAEPRGYLYFSNYSSVTSANPETTASYDLDFVVLYGNSSFGPAAPYYPTNGGEMLRTARLKKVVGYPAEIWAFDEGDPQREGHYYQHNTDPFSIRASKPKKRKRFHRIEDASAGAGNSGGPVYVRNASGSYGLAGIFVSGHGSLLGIHALDAATYSMGSDALARVGINDGTRVRKRLVHRKRFRIPSGKKKYRQRRVRARGFLGHVSELRFRAKFVNRGRRPLQAYLKAPSGRYRFVARGKKFRRRKVRIDKNLSQKFRLAKANGGWRLYMRDRRPKKPGKRVVLKRFSLTISD